MRGSRVCPAAIPPRKARFLRSVDVLLKWREVRKKKEPGFLCGGNRVRSAPADERAGVELLAGSLPNLGLGGRRITQNSGSLRGGIEVSGPGLICQYLALGPIRVGTYQRHEGGVL